MGGKRPPDFLLFRCLCVCVCVCVWMVAASSYFEDAETRGKCTGLGPRILRKPITLSPQNRKAKACVCLLLGGCFKQEHSLSPLGSCASPSLSLHRTARRGLWLPYAWWTLHLTLEHNGGPELPKQMGDWVTEAGKGGA